MIPAVLALTLRLDSAVDCRYKIDFYQPNINYNAMSNAQLGNLISQNKPYQAFFMRRKLNAFVLSSLAAFILMCLAWTFSVQGFDSLACIIIDGNGETDPEHVLQRFVSEEMSNESLAQHILIAGDKAGIQNDDILNRRFDDIRQAFDFQIRKRKGAPEYQLSVQFSGNGSEGEQMVLKSVVSSITQKAKSAPPMNENTELVDQQYQKIQRNIELFAANRQAQLEQTDQLVQHLDADLSLVYQQVEQLRSLPSMQSDAQTRIDGPSGSVSIINVSHLRDTAIDGTLDSIVALDTDTIHSNIGEINHSIRSDAIQQREDIATLRVLSDNVADDRFDIRSVSDVRNIPNGGVPSNAQLMLIGFIAVALGSVVTTYFRPELLDRGFESTESAENVLGTPVIAKILSNGKQGDNHAQRPLAISNHIVQWSEIALFTVALVLIFICFLYPNIRETFFENPFHGLTKVAWLFFAK